MVETEASKIPPISVRLALPAKSRPEGVRILSLQRSMSEQSVRWNVRRVMGNSLSLAWALTALGAFHSNSSRSHCPRNSRAVVSEFKR